MTRWREYVVLFLLLSLLILLSWFPAYAAYECFTVPNLVSAAFTPQARVFEADIRILANAQRGNGIVWAAGACLVTQRGAGANMSVDVTNGCTVVSEGATAAVASGNVVVSAADATFPRIDIISVTNAGVKTITAGTPATNPLPPTMPQSGGVDNIALAFVYVPAADSAITSDQIVDKRACVNTPGGGGGAGTGLSYITKVAEGTLSNEFALGSLATGLLVNTTTTGVPTVLVPTDDNIAVGNGTAWQLKALPTCSGGTDALAYNVSTNTFTCNTIATAGTGLSYITKVAEAGLSNEFALGSLATGVLINTTTTGVPTILAAQTCTNQFVRSYNASATATCSAVSLTADVSGITPVANGGTGLASGTSGGILAYTASGTLASSGALTANLPVIGGGAGVAPTVGTRSGNTTAFVTTTGTQTSGDCVKIDANGNHVANGSSCAGSGAPSTATYITQTADAGLSAEQALSSLATGYMKVTTGTGVITSQAVPIPVADGGTGLTSGTSGGVLAYTASGTLASSGALTANLPVIGGGAGVAPSVGTRSGNTTAYVTTTGTQTSGDCVKIDANGNHVANGSACGSGGGNAETWAVVTADVTHTQSNTVLSDVTGLSVAVCAASTEVWQIEVSLIYTTTGTATDWKFGWTFPTGMTMRWGAHSADPTVDHWGGTATGASPLAARIQTDTLSLGSGTSTSVLLLRGFAFCSSTSGTLQLQFAQNTSTAVDNIINKGSFMTARKIIP